MIEQPLLNHLMPFRFRRTAATRKLEEKFECPICGYLGPFEEVNSPTGCRKHARCPLCGSLERHRLQYLVARMVFDRWDPSARRMLHFAPERTLSGFFAKQFRQYETADWGVRGLDHVVDLQSLPFADATYDFIFASHVLEHIPNDREAIREIRRVLAPDGIAVLPVPLVGERTVEYPAPNPHELNHVRAPGFDYFDRYAPHFSRVEQHASDTLPARHQLYIYEDRTGWPTPECPLRPAMEGERHIDIVPVCYA